MGARATLAACVVILAATGCADDGPPPPPTRVAGLTATLEQFREDEIRGLLSVQATNGSAATVRFEDLSLEWPGFEDAAPIARSTQLGPGITHDVRVHAAPAVCGEPPTTDRPVPADAAVAVGHVSIDDAPPVLVEVPIDDTRGILPKVFARSCREQRLAWAADLRFGDTWTPTTTATGAPAELGTLELARTASDAPLTVTQVNGSVLLRITPVDGTPAVLPADQDHLSIPIVVEQAGNCSAHALAESKKTFIIPIGVAVGAEEPAAYVVRFGTDAQRLMNGMINESCGLD